MNRLTEESNQERLTWRKKTVFALVLTLFVGCVLETALRAVGFRYNPQDFDRPFFQKDASGHWATNSHYLDHGLMKAIRHGSSGPIEVNLVHQQSFPVVKASGVRRVVLIGGSTVHDWREARTISQELSQGLGSAIEIVNMGLPGCSSRREVLTFREAIGIGADVVIYHTGHNEFLNLSSAESFLSPPRGLTWPYRHSRILQFSWWMGDRPRTERDIGEYLGAGSESTRDFFKNLKVIRAYEPRDKEVVYRAFHAHLTEIARLAKQSQIELVFCTAPYSLLFPAWTAVPLADIEPLDNERLKARLQAAGPDGYVAGRALAERQIAGGDFVRAKETLETALLACQKPMRADPRLNAIIREVAQSNNLPLAPLKELIDSEARHGIAGEDIFSDQCHLLSAWRSKVQHLIARTVLSSARGAGVRAN